MVRHIFISAFLFVTTLTTWANDEYYIEEDSTHILNEVLVTAQTYKEVIPVQKLNGKQLEALNSHSVADAIRYFSGVQIKDYGGVGGIKTVDIRSMGTNHMVFFMMAFNLAMLKTGRLISANSLSTISKKYRYTTGRKATFFSQQEISARQARSI